MKKLHKVPYYKNEMQEVCFGTPKEPFDFTNAKNLYIELKDGDITPLLYLKNKFSLAGREGTYGRNLFTPYLPQDYDLLNGLNSALYLQYENIYHIGGYSVLKPITAITPDLSNYIPEDNAVLFLSVEVADKYADECYAWFLYQKDFLIRELNSEMDIRDWKKITIFIESLTSQNIEEISNIAKELKEKYKVEEVNVFALHCFNADVVNIICYVECNTNFNKITTTNSTGILEPQKSERLEAIDCYDIFSDYLNKN